MNEVINGQIVPTSTSPEAQQIKLSIVAEDFGALGTEGKEADHVWRIEAIVGLLA